MRRLEIADTDIIRIAIQNEIQRSEESRYDHRLHGVLLSCSGMSSYEIAALLGHSPRTVQYWIGHFQEHGFAGLQEGERPGRPSAFSEDVLQAVGQDLRREPKILGYSKTFWDGRLLRHHLKTRYQIDIGVRQCQRLFHHLGFRRRKPRAMIAQADPEAKAASKKTPKIGSKRGHGFVVRR
jgi:transposase